MSDIENKKAWVYIHIPKTAGMFLKDLIKNSKDTSKILDPFSENTTYSVPIRNAPSISFVRQQIPASNDERIGFIIIVRNPYDRLHSLWKWSRLNGEIGNLDFPQVENNFEDYVLNLSSGKYDTCYFMQKQSFWFTGQENCYVKTMKFEELNTTVKTFFETNGVTWSDTKVNESPGPDYKTAYTPKMIEIVKERFKDEFETFGYSADLW